MVPGEVVGVIRTVVTELWGGCRSSCRGGGGGFVGSGVTNGTNPAGLAPPPPPQGGPSVAASSGETPTLQLARAAGPSSSGECVWYFSCSSINPR